MRKRKHIGNILPKHDNSWLSLTILSTLPGNCMVPSGISLAPSRALFQATSVDACSTKRTWTVSSSRSTSASYRSVKSLGGPCRWVLALCFSIAVTLNEWMKLWRDWKFCSITAQQNWKKLFTTRPFRSRKRPRMWFPFRQPWWRTTSHAARRCQCWREWDSP